MVANANPNYTERIFKAVSIWEKNVLMGWGILL
jgi:hypothetical protein